MRCKILKICILLSSILLMGCEKKVDYEFLHSLDEVSVIEIVKVNDVYENDELKQEKMSEIENINEFFMEFQNLDCYSIYTDPQGIEGEQEIIKITYENGEYELIDVDGQATYTHSKKFKNYRGYYYFEQDQFDELINKYSD